MGPVPSRLLVQCLGVVLGLMLGGGSAHADDDQHQEGTQVPNVVPGVHTEVHTAVDHHGMFGVGGRLELPIVQGGMSRGRTRDVLGVSLGADVLLSRHEGGEAQVDGYTFAVAVAQWNMYLGESWSIFPEVGIALRIGPESDQARLPVQPAVGVGVRHHFVERFAALVRLNTRGGLQLGLMF